MRQKGFVLLCAAVVGVITVLPCAVARAESLYDQLEEISLKELSGAERDWRAVVFEGNSTETTEYPVKLCFRKGRGEDASERYCYATQEWDDDDFVWEYPIFQELRVIDLVRKNLPRKGLLFTARYFGGGSDWRDKITIWTYDEKNDRFVNIMPDEVSVTSQDEYAIVPVGIGEIESVLVTAHYRWGRDEIHFDPHFYRISIYAYSPTGGFQLVGRYMTEKKYPSLEDTSIISVIGPETDKIKEFISTRAD